MQTTLKPGLFHNLEWAKRWGCPLCWDVWGKNSHTALQQVNSLLPASSHMPKSEALKILLFCPYVLKMKTLQGLFFLAGFLKKAYSWISCNPYLISPGTESSCTHTASLCQRIFSMVPNITGAGCFRRQRLAWSPSQRIKFVHNMIAPARSTSSPAQPVFCFTQVPGGRDSWYHRVCGAPEAVEGINSVECTCLFFSIDSFRPHTGPPCRTAVNTAYDRVLAKASCPPVNPDGSQRRTAVCEQEGRASSCLFQNLPLNR